MASTSDTAGVLQSQQETGGNVEPPWDRARKTRSFEQERNFSRRPRAKPQINSGRVWHSLRDNTERTPFTERLLIDHKTTEAGSYRVEEDEWIVLRDDANRTPPGCLPALQIDIRDLNLFVVDLTTWDAAMERILELEMEVDRLGQSEAAEPGT